MFTTKFTKLVLLRHVFRVASNFNSPSPAISACGIRFKYDLSNKGVKGGNHKKGRFAGDTEEDLEELDAHENVDLHDDKLVFQVH